MKFGKEFDAKLEAILLSIYENPPWDTSQKRRLVRQRSAQIKRLLALEIHGEESNHETKTV
jgi:hypothetical protein